MVELDSATLIVAIQSVEFSIKHHEKMLQAEVLGDRGEMEEYLYVLENTKTRLKEAFLEEKKHNSTLPEYSSLLEIRI